MQQKTVQAQMPTIPRLENPGLDITSKISVTVIYLFPEKYSAYDQKKKNVLWLIKILMHKNQFIYLTKKYCSDYIQISHSE